MGLAKSSENDDCIGVYHKRPQEEEELPIYKVNTMAADGLEMEGAKASAAMELTLVASNILLLVQKGLQEDISKVFMSS